MFSISRSQLHILSESTIEGYLDRVTDRIRADFPSELEALPGESLRSRVQAAYDWFRAQGFERKEYLHRLIVLELLFGPRFEAHLPPTVLVVAFPPPNQSCPSEPERFWAIYRAADQLTRSDAHAVSSSRSEVEKREP